MPPSYTTRLALPPMLKLNADPHQTAYTVTVDAAHPALTTGISAHDRALTCRTLAAAPAAFAGSSTLPVESSTSRNGAAASLSAALSNGTHAPTNGTCTHASAPSTAVDAVTAGTSSSLRRPGHVLPLCARPGGVRERPGHTEAAVELCRLAGKRRVGVISELVDDGEEVSGQARRVGGGMMRRDVCVAFARRWRLRVCTIEALRAHVEKVEGKEGVERLEE